MQQGSKAQLLSFLYDFNLFQSSPTSAPAIIQI